MGNNDECCQGDGYCPSPFHCYKDLRNGNEGCCTDSSCTVYLSGSATVTVTASTARATSTVQQATTITQKTTTTDAITNTRVATTDYVGTTQQYRLTVYYTTIYWYVFYRNALNYLFNSLTCTGPIGIISTQFTASSQQSQPVQAQQFTKRQPSPAPLQTRTMQDLSSRALELTCQRPRMPVSQFRQHLQLVPFS